MKTQTFIQLLAAASTVAAAQYGNAVTRGLSSVLQPPRRINGRAGTGPAGVLTVDDSDYNSPGDIKFASLSSAASNEAMASEHVEGAYTSCVPVFTGATVPDCQAVLGDIRANNGTITVEGGLCMNWWEGTCLARVCARGEKGTAYSQDARWIADAIEENALDVCVASGESGVVADCEDNADPCGTYRFWLQSHP